jgi:transposase
MQERRRKFTPEFRDEAVKMVIETSRPITEREVRELRMKTEFLGKAAAFVCPERNVVTV